MIKCHQWPADDGHEMATEKTGEQAMLRGRELREKAGGYRALVLFGL